MSVFEIRIPIFQYLRENAWTSLLIDGGTHNLWFNYMYTDSGPAKYIDKLIYENISIKIEMLII